MNSVLIRFKLGLICLLVQFTRHTPQLLYCDRSYLKRIFIKTSAFKLIQRLLTQGLLNIALLSFKVHFCAVLKSFMWVHLLLGVECGIRDVIKGRWGCLANFFGSFAVEGLVVLKLLTCKFLLYYYFTWGWALFAGLLLRFQWFFESGGELWNRCVASAFE